MKKRSACTIAMLIMLLSTLPVFTARAQDEIISEGVDELLIEGGRKAAVLGSVLILTGNITVKDNSELTITNSAVRLSVRGERTYNTSALDSATIVFRNSTLETLSDSSIFEISDNASVTLVNTDVIGFKKLFSSNISKLMIRGGQLDVKNIDSVGESLIIQDGEMLSGKPARTLNVNATRATFDKFKGDIVLLNVTQLAVNGLECNLLNASSTNTFHVNNSKVKEAYIQSEEEVIVSDSSFNSLTFLSSGIAINVVTNIDQGSKAGGPIFAAQNTTVRRYWYMNLNVTDQGGMGVPAKITLIDYYNNTILTTVADFDGTYRKPILAEIVNSTKTYFLGNYRIRAEYLNYSTPTVPLILDTNRDFELKFPGDIPLETATTLMVSPSTIKLGEPVMARGLIASKMPGELVEITLQGPEGIKISRALFTDENGGFEGEFKPDIPGQWVVSAEWITGSQGVSAKSRAFTITVEARPSTMDLLIRALPIIVIVLGVLVAFAFLALSRIKRIKV